VISRPFASRSTAESRTTSPVRTVRLRGVSSTRAIVLATTVTAAVAVAGASVAVSTARPGAVAVTTPSSSTATIDGALELHRTASLSRTSSAFE
jgi:hypothetical protein